MQFPQNVFRNLTTAQPGFSLTFLLWHCNKVSNTQNTYKDFSLLKRNKNFQHLWNRDSLSNLETLFFLKVNQTLLVKPLIVGRFIYLFFFSTSRFHGFLQMPSLMETLKVKFFFKICFWSLRVFYTVLKGCPKVFPKRAKVEIYRRAADKMQNYMKCKYFLNKLLLFFYY